MCIPDSRYGLTLEWVTSENSTMLLESDILFFFFFFFFFFWGYQEQRKVCNTTCMCIPDSRYGLTLEWVTSENSTMLLESDILRLFFTGPYLVSSPLCSVSGVDCPSVLPRQLLCSPLSCPVSTAFSLLSSRNCLSWAPATNSLSLLSNYQLPLLLSNYQLPLLLSNYQLPLSGSRRQLSFASPYHFRVRRDFRSKNPLSGFAPKQTRLLWRPTPIVLHTEAILDKNRDINCG